MRRRNLRDMSVLITGASSGIGRALAVQLARRGARLVLAARRAERLKSLLRELGGRAHLALPADVSEDAQCRRLIELAIAHLDGRLDTLVCNAGFGLIRPLWRTGSDEMLELFRTNVLGATGCIRRAVPHMLAQEAKDGVAGQVVIVSSAVARRGVPGLGAYSATKAAQLALAEALRVELRGSGVFVTTVHPALTRTEFFRAAIRRSRARPPISTRRAQSAEHVASRIIHAIEHPRPEVWPNRMYRWLTTLATVSPRTADLVMWLRLRERRCLAPPSHYVSTLEIELDPEESAIAP